MSKLHMQWSFMIKVLVASPPPPKYMHMHLLSAGGRPYLCVVMSTASLLSSSIARMDFALFEYNLLRRFVVVVIINIIIAVDVIVIVTG